MAKKKKTLPKNFDELIKENNLGTLKNVFETCELDARGGYGKETALSFYGVPDELVRWLVENGADIEAVPAGADFQSVCCAAKVGYNDYE